MMDKVGSSGSLFQVPFCCPSPHKAAKNVAQAMQKHVFPVIGLPSIIHNDNGHEFVNKLIERIISTWRGQVQLVHGIANLKA